jgi:4-hydroxybenzoate polyprenyltransferase
MPKSSFPEAATPLRSEQSAKIELRLSNLALDLIAFSSVFPAVIAAGLSLAASHAMGAEDASRWAVLAASGTFTVYGLDRLRDTDRDRATSPKRTYFVEIHARAISIAVGLSALVLVAALLTSPAPVVLLCVGIGAIGLLHRRLKGSKSLKSIYVSLAWVAICAGIPAIATPGSSRFGWVAVIFSTGIAANLLASNLGDDPASPSRGRLPSILGLARSLAIVGVLISWAAPEEVAPLGWIPFAEAIALAFYRPNEHYEHLAVDGALLAGALASLVHFQLG